MKNLKPLAILILLILSTSLIMNCETTEQDTISPGENLEAVLSEIAKLGETEQKIITFEIIFDKRSGTYAYDKVEIIKESKQVIDFIKGADPAFKYMESSYDVECVDAQGNTTITNCPDYACVGYAVASCVENGGCAQVCKADGKYYPSAIK